MSSGSRETNQRHRAPMIAQSLTAMAAIALGAVLAGCGGGGGDDGTSSGGSASAGIGAARGSVTLTSGAQVAMPAGALATPTTIGVAQSGAGAPVLPAGATAFGPMLALTLHGAVFALPATIAVPFDPALVPTGTTPVLYKTNTAMTGWAEVPRATVNGSRMSGAVTGVSFTVVGPKPPPALEKGAATRDWVVATQGLDHGTE